MTNWETDAQSSMRGIRTAFILSVSMLALVVIVLAC